jgi:hypothetical protein
VRLRQREKPLRLLFVRLGAYQELLRLLVAHLRLHEELKCLLPGLVGLLFVRLRLLKKQVGRLLGVPRRLFLVLRGPLIVQPGAILFHPEISLRDRGK